MPVKRLLPLASQLPTGIERVGTGGNGANGGNNAGHLLSSLFTSHHIQSGQMQQQQHAAIDTIAHEPQQQKSQQKAQAKSQAWKEENGWTAKWERKGKCSFGPFQVARQMLPIWGGLIDEGVPVPSISRDKEEGNQQQQPQELEEEQEEGSAGTEKTTKNEQQRENPKGIGLLLGVLALMDGGGGHEEGGVVMGEWIWQ